MGDELLLATDEEIKEILTEALLQRTFKLVDEKSGEAEYHLLRNPFTLKDIGTNFYKMDKKPYFVAGFNDPENPFYIGQKLAPIKHNYQYGFDMLELTIQQRDQFQKQIDDDPSTFLEKQRKWAEQTAILENLTQSQKSKGDTLIFMNHEMWGELQKEKGFNNEVFQNACYWNALKKNKENYHLNVMWATLAIESFLPLVIAGNYSWPVWLALIPATLAQIGWKRTLWLAAESVLLTEGISYYANSNNMQLSGHSICSAVFAGQELWTGVTNRKTMNPWTRWLAPIPGAVVSGLYLKLYYDTGGAGTVGHTFHALGILWGFTTGYQMNNTNFLR